MITVLRKHHRWLMIVIAILAIPFCFYFTKSDLSAPRIHDFGHIYDHVVTSVEFQRNARFFNLARQLGMFSFLQDLTVGAQTENDAYVEFTWNRIILDREEERLGIRPSSTEIAEFVKTLRPFRGESGFDINKYNEFVQTTLPSMGFNESHLEELVSDQVGLNRLKDVLNAAAELPESESRESYNRLYGKTTVAVARFRSDDLAKEVKVTDEDIAKYFETHKAQLKSEEKRKVEFVTLTLSEEEKKKTGKEHVDALQKLADRANDFTQALLEKDATFAAAASKAQLPLHATADFTAAAPDPQFAGNPQLGQAAFQLTQKEPNSDSLQVADGYYIEHLSQITEAKPLTLEEAKPKITETLKTDRLHELVANKGAELAGKLREASKAGSSLEKVAQENGAKLDQLPPFSLLEETPAEPAKEPKKDDPDLPMIKNAVGELSAGDVSDFQPTANGGLVAVVEKRTPVETAAYDKGKADFDARFLRNKRAIVFHEWLRDRRQVAGIRSATG